MRARKVDATQAQIVKDLRYCGYLVYLINKEIDAAVCGRGRIWLMDFKSKDGRLTNAQQKLVDAGWPILFPKTSQEALEALKP